MSSFFGPTMPGNRRFSASTMAAASSTDSVVWVT
jgi:hypothetical protein